MGFIYLIQPCELIGTNRYKIGCSEKPGLDRLLSYKKGTRFICFYEVSNPFTVETSLKLKFSSRFPIIAGQEYYEGNEIDIKTCFINFISGFCEQSYYDYAEQNTTQHYHEVPCCYKNYCERCKIGILSDNKLIIEKFCLDRCDTCDQLRKTEANYYNKQSCNKLLDDLTKNSQKEQITVINDNNKIDNQPFVFTKDRYYYTILTASGKTPEEQMNRLQIYICRINVWRKW